VSPIVVAGGVAAQFLGAYVYGQWTGHWNTNLPEQIYFQLIPRADEFAHP
jgi:hypothetical protein